MSARDESPATHNGVTSARSQTRNWRGEEGECLHCGAVLPPLWGGYGPVPNYCNQACRQAAYRARRKAATS